MQIIIAVLKVLSFVLFGVVFLTVVEDPRWLIQGVARLLHPPKTLLSCKRGRCR